VADKNIMRMRTYQKVVVLMFDNKHSNIVLKTEIIMGLGRMLL
jgi:hypothetical protein